MRTIKFRAWDGEELHYFGEAYPSYPDETFFIGMDGNRYIVDSTHCKKENEILIMQYTGLTDRNGKEIYEGDIVKWKPWEGFEEITPIEWDQAMCRYVCRTNEGTWRMFGSDLTFEVIGNIYSNPELVSA